MAPFVVPMPEMPVPSSLLLWALFHSISMFQMAPAKVSEALSANVQAHLIGEGKLRWLA